MQDKQQRELIDKIITELNEEIDVFKKYTLNRESIGRFWFDNIDESYKKLKDKADNLINFRRNNLVVMDNPNGRSWPYRLFSKLPYSLQPNPSIKLLEDVYRFIQEQNLTELVRGNPISDVGHPLYFEKKGMRFTYRWIRHIWFLSLFKKYLEPYTQEIKVALDIGSSYGAFQYLIKRNYPNAHLILVDLPEQNAVARYYLKSEFPDCRIAAFKEIRELDEITRDFVSNYDFILVPCFYLEKLGKGLADLVTNFVSFNEMPRQWLDFYLQSDVFKNSKFLFMVNRIIKEQNPGVRIGILDMPLNDYEHIYFDVCPYFKWLYEGKYFLGIPYKAEKVWHDPVYEYIGRRKGIVQN